MITIYYIIQPIVYIEIYLTIIIKIKLMNISHYILVLTIIIIKIVMNVIHLIKVKLEGYAFLVNFDIFI